MTTSPPGKWTWTDPAGVVHVMIYDQRSDEWTLSAYVTRCDEVALRYDDHDRAAQPVTCIQCLAGES